ncbi:MAG: hypothetical protein KTR31_08020 [Myxococcales bacterium]|nr:hypothetical protein [Myxococcales bacterium]
MRRALVLALLLAALELDASWLPTPPPEVSATGWGPPLTLQEDAERPVSARLVQLRGREFAVVADRTWHVFDPRHGEVARVRADELATDGRTAWRMRRTGCMGRALRPETIHRFPPSPSGEAPSDAHAAPAKLHSSFTDANALFRGIPWDLTRALYDPWGVSWSDNRDRAAIWNRQGRIVVWEPWGDRWEVQLAAGTEAMLTADGALMVAERGGRLALFDAATGQRLDDPHRSEAQSPALEHRPRHEPTCDARLRCPAARPGQIRFHAASPSAEWLRLAIDEAGCGIAWADDQTLWFADPHTHTVQIVASQVGPSEPTFTTSGGLQTGRGAHRTAWTSEDGLLSEAPPWNDPALVVDDVGQITVSEGYGQWRIAPDGSVAVLSDRPADPPRPYWIRRSGRALPSPPPARPSAAGRTVYPGPRATRIASDADGEVLCTLPVSDVAVLSPSATHVALSDEGRVSLGQVSSCRLLHFTPPAPSALPSSRGLTRQVRCKSVSTKPEHWTCGSSTGGRPARTFRWPGRAPHRAQLTEQGHLAWLTEGTLHWLPREDDQVRTVPSIQHADALDQLPDGTLVVAEPGVIHLLDDTTLQSLSVALDVGAAP